MLHPGLGIIFNVSNTRYCAHFHVYEGDLIVFLVILCYIYHLYIFIRLFYCMFLDAKKRQQTSNGKVPRDKRKSREEKVVSGLSVLISYVSNSLSDWGRVVHRPTPSYVSYQGMLRITLF